MNIYNIRVQTSKINKLKYNTCVAKRPKLKNNIIIDNISKNKIEEWTGRKLKSIVFDSDKDNWD